MKMGPDMHVWSIVHTQTAKILGVGVSAIFPGYKTNYRTNSMYWDR